MDLMTANRLQQLRKQNGYTQEVLAEKLGISRQSISKWERAEASPDTDNLIALSKIYGISVDELLDTSSDITVIKTQPKDSGKDIKGKIKSVISKANDFGMYPELAKTLLKIPFPLLIVVLYVCIGLVLHIWHPTWILFILIPIYYRFALSLKAGSKKALAFMLPIPEVIVTLFLILGFTIGNWGVIWILFLIIPIYYWVCFYIK